MPDAIAPVGAMVQTPPPINAVGTLSSLYGIQQQKQALQTGQYLQQSAQAGAQQDQQKNNELQALARFTHAAASDPSYMNADGTPNVQKYQQGAMAVAPTYGQAYIGNATANFTGAVHNRSALLNLSNEQRQTAGNYLAAEAANPNSNAESFRAMTQNMRGVSDDPGYQSAVDTLLQHAPNTVTMPDAQASQVLRNYARQVGVATQAPDAGLSAPTTADYTTPGGQIGQRQTNPLAPQGTGPIGGSTPQGLGPTQTAAYQGAISSAAARATGMAGTDIDRVRQVSAAIAPSAAAIPLTQEIDDLADQIHSGVFAAKISSAAQALGESSDTYARQILAKDLGQVETRATDFGNPTDKKLGTILSGFPDPTSDNRTIHTAMDYVRGSFRQNVARGQNMLAYQKAHPDAAGFQQSDDQLTSKVDPLTSEYLALKPGTARQGFLQRNFKTADEAQAFASQAGQ